MTSALRKACEREREHNEASEWSVSCHAQILPVIVVFADLTFFPQNIYFVQQTRAE